MSEIHAGIALKPVNAHTHNADHSGSTGGGTHDDVLAQIRQGTNLKPVREFLFVCFFFLKM
ncbi:unnamed protein product [Anisakis simplex]|uniref:WH2 domain-containing protein n=1 Tax=Anisakis simplex TaxID=6269 RepID=A0A3P6PTJ7_ANISI|nr:unnamed protein product [Anisakis simplex]